MALAGANRPKPGLKAVYEGREGRKPGGKYARPSTGAYLFAVSAMLGSLVVWHFVSEHELDTQRHDLLAQQRAAKSTIGTAWVPLRDEVEAFTLDAAKEYKGDFVDSEAARWDFRSVPGIYLRMRLGDAKSVDSLREAAAGSQKDAFTGCFLREPNKHIEALVDRDSGEAVSIAPALAAGKSPTELGVFPEQPWNLGQAYAATWIMTDDWAAQVKAADDKMKVRLLTEQYERAAKVDMKTAAEVVKQAKFFLLVLDEPSADAAKEADGGPPSEASLQLVAHESRVHVLDLRTKAELLRVRREGNARFMFAGEHAATDSETRDAMQRQVNNCSLADQVRAAIVEKADGGAK